MSLGINSIILGKCTVLGSGRNFLVRQVMGKSRKPGELGLRYGVSGIEVREMS